MAKTPSPGGGRGAGEGLNQLSPCLVKSSSKPDSGETGREGPISVAPWVWALWTHPDRRTAGRTDRLQPASASPAWQQPG